MHNYDCIHSGVNIKFSDTLFRRLNLILRLIGCVLNKTGINVDSSVQKVDFSEKDSLSTMHHNVQDWAVISNYINFFLSVFFIEN